MITISLDEQGVFEKPENGDKKIVVLAGVIFDDKGDPRETKREKERIRAYFEKICDDCGGRYPMSLHACDDHPDGNKQIVKRVKERYRKTLGDFLNKGLYENEIIKSNDGRCRAGNYCIYAMLKSPTGKKALSSPKLSNLVDEKRASNLYMHMAEDVISRLLFYNGFFEDENRISLDLATRVFVGEKNDDVEEYLKMGYKQHEENSKVVHLTNTDVYRTAIEREMLLSGYNKKKIEPLRVRSIKYRRSAANRGMEFLYLSDAICSCIGFNTRYKGNYIDSVQSKMKNLCNYRLLFLYDDTDTKFVRAWKFANDGELFKALSILYDVISADTLESAFYKKAWEKELIKKIGENVDELTFSIAVNQLVSALKSNKLGQERVKYVFDMLAKLVELVDSDDIKNRAVLYDLYDSGITVYNHIGDSARAKKYIKKCDEYNQYIGMEKIIRNRHRSVVSKCDSFEFNSAKEMALDSICYFESSYDVQKTVLNGKTSHLDAEYGVACSQLGQVYSYMRDSKAEIMFEKALRLEEYHSSDYFITESYYLQYLIDCNNRSGYERIALDYYGTSDLWEQLKHIVEVGTEKNPVIGLKYAVYAYLKAIYTFYLDDLDASMVSKLSQFEETINSINPEAAKEVNSHPWELSYKYLSMIMQVKGRKEISTEYERKMKARLKEKGKTIKIIELFGEVELSVLRGDGEDIKKIKKICDLITTGNPEIKKMDYSFEEIKKHITYTYR